MFPIYCKYKTLRSFEICHGSQKGQLPCQLPVSAGTNAESWGWLFVFVCRPHRSPFQQGRGWGEALERELEGVVYREQGWKDQKGTWSDRTWEIFLFVSCFLSVSCSAGIGFKMHEGFSFCTKLRRLTFEVLWISSVIRYSQLFERDLVLSVAVSPYFCLNTNLVT